MQNTPISTQDRAKLSADYAKSWTAQGKKLPKSEADILKYELGKEMFIEETLLKRRKSASPVLKNLLGTQAPAKSASPMLEAVRAAQQPKQSQWSAVPPASISPQPKMGVGQQLFRNSQAPTLTPSAPTASAESPWSAIGRAGSAIADFLPPSPYASEKAPGRGWFDATPLPQTPKIPPNTVLPDVKVAPPVLPPGLPNTGGSMSAGASRSMGGGGGAVDSSMIQAYLAGMRKLADDSTTTQQTAGNAQIGDIKAAYEKYLAETGKQGSALDFYREQMQGIKRPDRASMQLSDEDKNSMLMRFGLNMLKNNRAGFGQALGTAGEEAVNFGDRANERRYNDAMEVYRDSMARLNTETQLSEKDRESLRKTADTNLAMAEKLAGAKFNVDTAKVGGNNTVGTAMTEGLRQAVELDKAAKARAAARENAYIAASAKSDNAGGLDSLQYSTLADRSTKYVESLKERLINLDKKSPSYNKDAQALQGQIVDTEKEGDYYRLMSKRAAGK
jgi:hypothetical protein